MWFPTLSSDRGDRGEGTTERGPQRGDRSESPDVPGRRRRAERLAADTASTELRAETTGWPSVCCESREGPFLPGPATEHLPRDSADGPSVGSEGARLGDRREAPAASASQLCLAASSHARHTALGSGTALGPARPGPACPAAPYLGPVPRVGDPLSPLLREEVASFQLEGKHRDKRLSRVSLAPRPHPARNRRDELSLKCAGQEGRRRRACRWLRWGADGQEGTG